MTATATRRLSTVTGTHLPSWWADRPASCQCCGAEIPNTERYCTHCWTTTERCPSCRGVGFHQRWFAGAPETEHCTRCGDTGRIEKGRAA